MDRGYGDREVLYTINSCLPISRLAYEDTLSPAGESEVGSDTFVDGIIGVTSDLE